MLSRIERELLRRAIDAATRARLAARRELEEEESCAGCGGPRRYWTLGCRTCADRHYAWARRRGYYPNGAGWFRWRRIEHLEWMEQERARKIREAARRGAYAQRPGVATVTAEMRRIHETAVRRGARARAMG
jgi:hypothetical protein